MCRITPPRVREVSCIIFLAFNLLGITPACAGSIFFNSSSSFEFWDHPRVCGKYLLKLLPYYPNSGSPPRVREVYIYSKSQSISIGITPACAGSILKKVNIYAISSIAFSKILLLSLLACLVQSNMLVLFYPLYIQSHIL